MNSFNSFLDILLISLISSLICLSLATILNPEYTVFGSMIKNGFEKFFYND